MKNIYLIASLFLLFVATVSAQHHECGQLVTPEQIAFLKANNPNLDLARRPSSDTIEVPILFHRIGRGDGSGAVTEAQVDAGLDYLNELYEGGNIVFKKCQATRLISDTTFFDYAYAEEFALRQAHEVPGVINIFIPNTLTSSSGGQLCGYAYLPPTRRDICMVKKSCFTNGTTLAHEVGHYLGLYHTHGTSNCGSLTDELADGSNCATAGDDVCDTPADPNLLGPDCDAYEVDRNCNYTGTRLDDAGQPFSPDPNNIMSYSRKACRQYFSAGQLDRVRYYLNTSRSYLGCADCPTTPISVEIIDWAMTYVNLEIFDVGSADEFEIEYGTDTVNTQRFTTSVLQPRLDGFSTCDQVFVRVRPTCAFGSAPWSAWDDVTLDGCNLRYCAQTNANSNLYIDDTKVGTTTLTGLETIEHYGVHPDTLDFELPAAQPMLPLEITTALNQPRGNQPIYLQVWIDFNDDGELVASERVVQREVASGVRQNLAIPIPATAPRATPLRVRMSSSIEYFIEPCDPEFGETEDFDIRFSDEQFVAEADWAQDTLVLDASGQVATASILVNGAWTASSAATWFGLAQTTGSVSETDINFDVSRNTGCDARSATVLLTNGAASATLVVVQQAPTIGIEIDGQRTVVLAPAGETITLSASAAHDYEVTTSPWLSVFAATAHVDAYVETADIEANTTDAARSGIVTFAGCGVRESVMFTQDFAQTAWVDTATILIDAQSLTGMLAVQSNVSWTATSNASWLTLVDAAGDANGEVAYTVAPDAPAGGEAFVTLSSAVSAVQGSTTVRLVVQAPSSTQRSLDLDVRFANPFRDRLHVRTNAATPLSFELMSATGQVLTRVNAAQSLDLPTSQLPAGIYLLHVRNSEGGSETFRLVKL